MRYRCVGEVAAVARLLLVYYRYQANSGVTPQIWHCMSSVQFMSTESFIHLFLRVIHIFGSWTVQVTDTTHPTIKILGLRGGKDSCWGLLGYDAVEPGRKISKFLRNILPLRSTGMRICNATRYHNLANHNMNTSWSWSEISEGTYVLVEWVVLLLRIWDISCSNTGP
jgi:hypothetical protein